MRTGSPSPHLEDLLRQIPWLSRLAVQVCADPGAADDLVQGTCAAAIEHPPSSPGVLRAWLGRVLRNLHHERHRSERARRAREQAQAAREALPAAADVVTRAEAARRLHAWVLDLPEPYRSTVLSRYFDELSAAEIARREGVTGSTVRTRLGRGLALLRERLRRNGEPTLAVLLLPAGQGAATVTAGWTFLGAMIVSIATKICVGAALAAALLWTCWPTTDLPPASAPKAAGSPHATVPAAPTIDAQPVDTQRNAVAWSEAHTAPRAEVPATAEASAEPSLAEIEALMTEVGPGTLEGIVLRGKKRVAGATVLCRQGWSPLPIGPRSDMLVARTDAEGIFRFVDLRSERYRVGVEGADGTQAETLVQVLAEQPSERVVLLLGSARIEGHVYDAEGRIVVGAWVSASLDTMRKKQRMGFETGRRTDARGAFVLDSLPAGVYWLVARRDGNNQSGVQPDSMQHLPELQVGETRVVDLGEPGLAAVWHGIVRTRSGAPVAGPATIALDESVTGIHQEAEYDEQGRFRIPLRPGTWNVSLVTRANWNERVKMDPITIGTTDLDRDLTLPGTRLCGTVVDQGAGQPWRRQRGFVEVSIHREGHDYPAAFQRLDAEADGTFTFEGLGPGTWLLSTRIVGFRNNARVELPGNNVSGQRVNVLAADLEVPVQVPLSRR